MHVSISNLSCFKAYDLRGRVPDEINASLALQVGSAFVAEFDAKEVVVGRDVRNSGPEIVAGLIQGLREAGANVTDIGLCGSEEIYFATFSQGFDGGIIVTASHNPADYNGMKFVRSGAAPVSGDTGLLSIRKRVSNGEAICARQAGSYRMGNYLAEYVKHLLGYVDTRRLKPLHIVADPGNGSAGIIVAELSKSLPFQFTVINGEPDGNFPQGVPNPLLPEKREATSRAVRESGADIGLAWDGDFDRCFFYDAEGNFVEGYYLVGLLAQTMLARHAGGKIVHDPRLIWNTQELVSCAGGLPVESKTGHAFIKERMRAEDAVYGGEMSAHHYFRDFSYCDSGMIPWLLITELICTTGLSLAQLVGPRIAAYPCSGEINRRVSDPSSAMAAVQEHFAPQATTVKAIDGLSLEFPLWRLNLRASNTEPLLRLNVESRGDALLLQEMTSQILAIVDSFMD